MTRVVFTVSTRRLDAHTSVVVLKGDLDLDSAPRLKRALLDELGAGRERLLVDLSAVGFIDSTGMGVLVGVRHGMSEDGVLAIIGASPAILKLLEVTGLERTFELFPTLEAALGDLQRRPLRRPGQEDERAMAAVDDAQVAAESPGEEGASGATARDAGRVSLSGDAAVVLGIAATAMPFAESKRAEAERWLRVLSRYGDAATALASLGFTEEVPERGPEREDQDRPRHPAARDPVATVTEHARRTADRRGVSTVTTTDLLGAVIDVYGDEFERVLTQHGITSDDLTERLGLD
jgi:anti-sigma B factor antagonist